MKQYVKPSTKIRKTITLSPLADKLLKNLSEFYKKPQSLIIEELIQEKAEKMAIKKRIESLLKITEKAKEYAGITEKKSYKELKTEKYENSL